MNNTEEHILSRASGVTFDPTDTAFSSAVKNAQQMAEAFDRNAIAPLPVATTSVKGLVRYAPLHEVLRGIDTSRAVSPYTLYEKWHQNIASTTKYGMTMYAASADNDEDMKSDRKSATTNGIWTAIEDAITAENARGSQLISTTAQATSGVDDTTAMTPVKVKAAINQFAVTSVPAATEAVTGTVFISPALVTDSSKHNQYVVSPKGFIQTRATTTRVGTIKIATQAEANALSDNTVALTPARMPRADYSRRGAVQLLHSWNGSVHSMAMSPHAGYEIANWTNNNIVAKSGSTMWGDLHGNLLAQNVNTGDGRSMINLNHLNSRISDQPSSTAFWRPFTNLWQGSWIHIGDFHYSAQSDGRWRGCEITLPTFHMEASGGGCRPWFHYFIRVEHSDGVGNRTHPLSRIWIPNDRYGNGLSASVTPTYTFPISNNATWTRVYIMIESQCMNSPRMIDGICLMSRTPY